MRRRYESVTTFWLVTLLIFLFSGVYLLTETLASSPDELVINEIMAGNVSGLGDEDGDYPDWIEVYNRSPYPINLSNWALTNDPNQPEKWSFPNVTLRPDEYLIVFASGKDRREVGPGKLLHTNFRLSRLGEFLALYHRLDDRFEEVISAEIPQFEDISYGRYGRDLQYAYLEAATPGQANSKLLAEAETVAPASFTVEMQEGNVTPVELATISSDHHLAWQSESSGVLMQDILDMNLLGFLKGTPEQSREASGLYITELMYQPLDGDEYEFIRLANLGEQPINLAGAYFAEGLSFVFPANTPPLAPGHSIVLVHNEIAFAGRYPEETIDGVYQGQLSNSGERITLRDLTSKVLVSMAYDDENSWPLSADGWGDSLILITPGDMNNPKNWRASSQVRGGADAIFLKP